MNPRIESLPVVVLHLHSRCNCRCMMCDIWKDTSCREISAPELDRYLGEFQRLSVRWVVLSGGEPLMHSDPFPFCARLRELGIHTTLLTTGLLLEKHAAQVVGNIDDVIVSLDGPAAVHDRIRRVPGAFARLVRGVDALHRLRANFPIAARSTVQRENFRFLRKTARVAEGIGLRSISFLAADVASTAFNRPHRWPAERQNEIALQEAELPELEAEIEALLAERKDDPFLIDSPDKLHRIVLHFRAHLGLCRPQSPRCNAPWVSAVIEADGVVRPCFFHEAFGCTTGAGLIPLLNGPAALAFRRQLDIETNPICNRCVCYLNWSPNGRSSG